MHEAKRIAYIRVMLTKEEKETLKQLAEAKKMKVGKFVRSCIFKRQEEQKNGQQRTF